MEYVQKFYYTAQSRCVVAYNMQVCVSTIYDFRTTTKSPKRRISQNVSPSLSDAYLQYLGSMNCRH